MKKSFSAILILLSLSTYSQEDTTVHYQRDSAIVQDCMPGFFQRSEKVPSMQQVRLITKAGKQITLAQFFKSSAMGVYAEYGLQDLDGDGKKELITFNYTGGAHCCDDVQVYKNIGLNKYQYVARLFAGDACIGDDNLISYRFYQQLGYFFTCFACTYEDTSDVAPIQLRGVALKFEKGKLTVLPGDQELRSTIKDNLGKLGEQPYVAVDPQLGQDNGLRKEFAMNMAVYYFSFGKNLIETQKLFNTYYKFPDSKKVWAEFVKHLQAVRKQSDF